MVAADSEVMLQGVSHPLLLIDTDYNLRSANRAAETYIGSKEYQGKRCFAALYNRQEPCPYCPRLQEWKSPAPAEDLDKKAPKSIDRLVHLHDQPASLRTVRLRFFQVILDHARSGIVEMIENVTQEMENQEETLRRENLAALGTMISGISHELNNPLTGLGLNLQNLEANLQTMTQSEIAKRLTFMRKDLNRAAQIVHDILNFTRPAALKISAADVSLIVQRARANVIRLHPVLSHQVEWDLGVKEDLMFPCQADKIERLLINLFRNSIQAFDYRPGRISVKTGITKRSLIIVVADNAGGIHKEVIKKIFRPFFTASSDGQGAGLGLSICYNIVKEHHGRLRVASTSQGETRFYIAIPGTGSTNHETSSHPHC